MEINKVLIAGSGTMGQQISFQCAFSGFSTVVYDVSEASLETCKKEHQSFAAEFVANRGASPEQAADTLARLTYSSNLPEAVSDVDLVNESISEDLAIKKSFYVELNKHCSEETIFTTNTSTLLPSEISASTGRPEKFLALHFAFPVWDTRLGDVMKTPETDDAIFERIVRFAAEIGMVPICLHKEQAGYLLNTILVPWLTAAQSLLTNEVSSAADVDKAWMLSSRMDRGPFAVMDMVGLETIYNVFHHQGEVAQDEQVRRNAQYIKTHFLDQDKLGVKTGEGYYQYPNPAFEGEDFLEAS
jgi:3-hydroxyacyl-CoA dehydrogenase